MSTKNRDSLLKALDCRIQRSCMRDECSRCRYGGEIDGLRYCDYHKIWEDARDVIRGEEERNA